MNGSESKHRLKRFVVLVLGNLLVLVALLIVLEGLAGWGVAIRALGDSKPVAERLHTKYDAQLGWVGIPNLRLPDMYGRGTALTTNSRGFRGVHEVQKSIPAGRIRIICSGDSFTLGYGVGDEQTWCSRLAALDTTLETVNMGQGGYGADQAYLWYRRDAQDLAHNILLFAFITEDFRRMTRSEFIGYEKPVLKLRDGRLVVENVPVPRRSFGHLGWFSKHAEALRSLHTVQLAEAVGRRLGGGSQQAAASWFDRASAILPLMFADMKRLTEQRGSRLVLVRLPTPYELRSGGADRWTRFLQEQAKQLGVPYINLLDAFKTLPPDTLTAQFITQDQTGFAKAAGHLDPAGNDRVARLLLDALAQNRLLGPAQSHF